MGWMTSGRDIDVLIVGAGPAGATAALNLAPMRQVVLIDRRPRPQPRIGESLPPAVRRLFTDMGLWESFLGEGHAPGYGNRAAWGSATPVETDFLRDPDGHGWHIDRVRFELWLRRIAVERGATILAPGGLESLSRDSRGWRAQVTTSAGPVEFYARVMIDAGGRAAPVGRSVGARWEREDKLVCGWLYGNTKPARQGAGLTYVEAAEDGWWYTAPVPGNRRVLAFHTDSDLPGARSIAGTRALLKRAVCSPELAEVLSASDFVPEHSGFCAAHTARLEPCAGSAWFAVGDAACSFDPLSSQGLLNALFTGLAAAEAADRYLSGDAAAQSGYAQMLKQVHAAYRQQLTYWYRAETRWSHAPFWQRRQ